MAFSFGFSGDDIEEDPNDISEPQGNTQQNDDVPQPIPARSHDLDELVGKLHKTTQSSRNLYTANLALFRIL